MPVPIANANANAERIAIDKKNSKYELIVDNVVVNIAPISELPDHVNDEGMSCVKIIIKFDERKLSYKSPKGYVPTCPIPTRADIQSFSNAYQEYMKELIQYCTKKGNAAHIRLSFNFLHFYYFDTNKYQAIMNNVKDCKLMGLKIPKMCMKYTMFKSKRHFDIHELAHNGTFPTTLSLFEQTKYLRELEAMVENLKFPNYDLPEYYDHPSLLYNEQGFHKMISLFTENMNHIMKQAQESTGIYCLRYLNMNQICDEIKYDSDDDVTYQWQWSDFLESRADTRQLSDFLESRGDLSQVSCIAIYTGYTDRIIMSKRKLNSLSPAVVFTDDVWNETLKPKIFNNMIYEIVKPIICKGICVFEDKDAKSVFDYIEALNDADYCSCCDIDNLMSLTWYKNKEHTILVAYVDTESG